MRTIERKISFCTVCMNRLPHLMQTMSQNILDNKNYSNIEFILLDYNSKDNLEEFIKKTFNDELLSGRLVYYKTLSPIYFNRSHSKNLAFKLATGSIICNLDADNFTGKNFAAYVNFMFSIKEEKIFLCPLSESVPRKDIVGRLCLKKEDFYSIGGYDERMVNYGFEDLDIINRLEIQGVKRILIDDMNFLKAITHDTKDRILNEYMIINLKYLLICHLTPTSSQLLFLLEDYSFIQGTLVDNNFLKSFPIYLNSNSNRYHDEHFLLEEDWKKGKWTFDDNILNLKSKHTVQHLAFNKTHNSFSLIKECNKNFQIFYKVTNPNLKEKAVLFYNLIYNRTLMRNNLFMKTSVVNPKGYGKDIVYKNFDLKTPIIVS